MMMVGYRHRLDFKANNLDDLDMDPPPPRRPQAGPSNIFTQLMGGGMGGMGGMGNFGGFARAALPEYVPVSVLIGGQITDDLVLTMTISKPTR